MAFKKLTAGLMASSMILGLAANVGADITTATPFEVANKMNKLGVVIGVGTNPDGTIDFNLGGNLTRAELVTTIVRSFGAEQAAQLAKGAPSFADVTADAWYSGYVAVAKNLAEQAHTTIGRDGTHFDPNANVSKAEALVFTMKFLGINVQSSGANWYEAWINKAVEMGIISKADAAIALANPGAAATRGEAFVILDFGYSAKVLEGGKSLYTAYVDGVAPTVEVAAPAESTAEAKVTISGKVSDNKAVASVAVNGKAVVVKDGNFSATVDLTLGANSIQVSANDTAGNSVSKSFSVTRVNAAATSIEAADITVAAGASADVAVSVKDVNGQVISGVTFTGESTVGTFADGKFTAGTKAGTGKLTLKYGELTKDVNVTVTAAALAKVAATTAGAPGEKIQLKATDAYGNTVEGVTYAQASADALLDSSTGAFIASKAGNYEVTATKGDVKVTGKVGVYGAVTKLAVSAATEFIGNNATYYEVKVSALDKNGTLVANFGETTATMGEAVLLEVPGGAVISKSGTASATGLFTAGVSTFKVKADASLVDSTITLNATFLPGKTTAASGEVDVNVVPQVATSVKVSSSPAYMASNDPTAVEITANVYDQVGKVMLNGVYDLSLKVTGAATLTDGAETDSLAWAPGAGNFDIFAKDGATTGPVTVTVSAEGLGTATATISAQIPLDSKKLKLTAPASTDLTAMSAGDADNVAAAAGAGAVLTYTVAVTDKNGVPTKESGVPLIVTFGDVDNINDTWVSVDGSVWTDVEAYVAAPGSLVTDASGEATFYVTSSIVDTFTVGVRENNNTPSALTVSATSSINVQAGTPDAAAFDTSANLSVLRGNPTKASLQASVTDMYGNAVKAAGVKISFHADTASAKLNGEVQNTTVTTDADGVAKVDLTAPAYVSDSILVSIASAKLGKDPLVVAGPGNSVLVANSYLLPTKLTTVIKTDVAVSPSYLTAGQAFDIVLTVKDNEGLAFDNVNLADLRFYVNGVRKTAFSVDQGADGLGPDGTGIYTLHVDLGVVKTLGTADLKVGIANLQDSLSVTKSVGVRAGTPVAIKVVEATRTKDVLPAGFGLEDSFEIKVKKNTRTAFTVQAVDKYGNAVTGSQVLTSETVTLDDTTVTGSYIQFTNESGVPIPDVTIAKGKIQGKFFLMTDEGGTITLSNPFAIPGAPTTMVITVTVTE